MPTGLMPTRQFQTIYIRSCPFGEDCHYAHGEAGNDNTGLVFLSYNSTVLFWFVQLYKINFSIFLMIRRSSFSVI